MEYLCQPNKTDQRPYEYAVAYSSVSIVKKIFDIKEMRDKFVNIDDLFRLLYHLFSRNRNIYLIDYVLSILNITKEKLAQVLAHTCSESHGDFDQGSQTAYRNFTIVGIMAFDGNVDTMKHLINIIDEDTFCDAVFMRDGWGDNAIQGALESSSFNVIKCILSTKIIKEKLMKDDNKLVSVLKSLNAKFIPDIAKYIAKELELTETKLRGLSSWHTLNVDWILSVM